MAIIEEEAAYIALVNDENCQDALSLYVNMIEVWEKVHLSNFFDFIDCFHNSSSNYEKKKLNLQIKISSSNQLDNKILLLFVTTWQEIAKMFIHYEKFWTKIRKWPILLPQDLTKLSDYSPRDKRN